MRVFVFVCVYVGEDRGEGHGYHGNGCVGLIRGLPAGVGSEARLGKRTVRGEFASVQPWRSAGGGWGGLVFSPPPPTSGFKGDPPTATTQSQWSLHWEQKSIESSIPVPHCGVSVPLLSSFAFFRMYHQHTFSLLLSLPHPYFLCPHFLRLSYSILFSSADGVCVPQILSLNWLYLICPQYTVMPWCICFLFRGI